MSAQRRKFLIFSLQDSLYALDLAHVAEVGDPPQLSPVPLAPPCYSGALSFHGDIIAAINLPLFLGLPEGHPAGKIVILRQNLASLALLVDSVVRIVLEDDISFCEPSSGCFAAATLLLTEGEAVLLDLESLVLSAERCAQGSG